MQAALGRAALILGLLGSVWLALHLLRPGGFPTGRAANPPPPLHWEDLSRSGSRFAAPDVQAAILFDPSHPDGPFFAVEDAQFLAGPDARYGRFIRFMDALTGGEFHGGDAAGKWLRVYGIDGRVLALSSYSRPERLDLSQLMPHAIPVDYETVARPRAAIQTLMAELAEDPSRQLLNRPLQYETHDASIVLTLPPIWARAAERMILREAEEQALSDWLHQAAGLRHPITLRLSRGTGTTFFDHHARLPDSDDTWVAARWREAGAVRQAVGFELQLYSLRVDCIGADCIRLARLDGAEAPPVLDRWRDPATRTALLAAGETLKDFPVNALSDLPDPSQLADSRVTTAAPVPVLYPLSWYRRR